MRAIWSGEIAFGLVTIPAKLYSATRDLTPRFHLIHKKCGTRLQTVRRCTACREDVSWDEVDKGYEVTKGEYARFSKEELAEVEGEAAEKGTIELVEFVDPAEVDLAFIEKSYWVGPSGKSAHSFALLRTVLQKVGKVAVAKVAIRTRTRLALLRPREKLYSLDMMRFAEELVDAHEVEVPIAKVPSERELKLARSLVDELSGEFDPQKHPDEYRARVSALVKEKVKRHEVVYSDEDVTKERGRSRRGELIDLSELLARSLKSRHKPGPAKTGPSSVLQRRVRRSTN